ncbi:Uncharacterised protein [Vibrio cholerae]|nr:Uncharacterised protein [Vibrio cholerae]
MPSNRHNPASVVTLTPKHARNMHQRSLVHNINQFCQLSFVAHSEEVVEQFRLRGFDFFRQFNGGNHIGHRIVRVAVLNAVGNRKMFQFKAGEAVIIFRPLDTFRTQSMTRAKHIQQIPTGIAVLPAPSIGVDKVAIAGVARHFIIKTYAVIT